MKQEKFLLVFGVSFFILLAVLNASYQSEVEFSVDVTGCSTEACEDMLEEVQSADLSSFSIKGGI